MLKITGDYTATFHKEPFFKLNIFSPHLYLFCKAILWLWI
ncbi:hypothetical protein ACIN8IBEIGE_80050 [Acinetobacter sp. 8I-beige]|nr:hypothetical protein ACIN8IBEIGE_80050 [Acinetobacter sp. 8I-beige]